MAYIGLAPGVSSQRMEDTFTATAGQTSFVPSSGYVPGNIDVYRNGVKLANGLEFTASDGITVVLNNACAAGDSVVLLSYIPRGLSDGYTKPEADSRYFAQSSSMGFRNRIINGDMRIDQRYGGTSVTPGAATTTYTLDRWGGYNSVGSKFSVQRNAGSVTPPSGFINYLGVTSLSAYTPLASDQLQVSQNIEGLNVADLNWGTANAAPVTLSFWVRSSLTGNFPVSLINSSNNRSYPFTYTINAANTWEYKTITIPGDTSGSWFTDTSTGIQLRFAIGYGSSFVGTANSWNAANVLSPSGAVNVCATNGATWYITGVQFEKGSSATPFEFRSIEQEESLCRRYAIKYLGNGTFEKAPGSGATISSTQGYFVFALDTKMRASPTLNYSNIAIFDGGGAATVTSAGADNLSPVSPSFFLTFSGSVAYRPMLIQANNSTASFILLSAEL